jgi:hypothetical protein
LAWKGSKEFERRSLPGVVKLRKANGGKKESSEITLAPKKNVDPILPVAFEKSPRQTMRI